MPPDICVVGGAGHIGAPLAIVLANCGYRVLVYDVNRSALETLARGRMPYREAGGDELLGRVIEAGALQFTSDPAGIAGIPNVVLATAAGLIDCIDPLVSYLSDDVCIIVRSTVAPGSIAMLDRHLRDRAKHVRLAFCPERSVEGEAIEEMQKLAQIVSGVDSEAARRARLMFERVAPEIVEMSVAEAEYAKLICNAYRYIQFAATNQLCMLAESAGLNYHELLGKMKRGYPRMANLPRAGFAAGPCLTKDTQQLVALGPDRFALGRVALSINEGMPEYIVARLAQHGDIEGKRIGVLGMAFKAQSDDPRNSLSYELGSLLRARGAVVYYSDEFVADPSFIGKDELVDRSDIVVIATPHDAYRGLEVPAGKVVVDTCGCLGG